MVTSGSSQPLPRRLPRALMLGASALCVAASLWAAFAPSGCASCEQASQLVGGSGLAVLGILFYAHLFAILLWKGPSRYVSAAVLAAVGVHVVLVMLLLVNGLTCVPCLLTACAAFALLAIALATGWRTVREMAFVLPVAVGLSMVVAGPYFDPDNPQVEAQKQVWLALDREAKDPPVPAGRVRIVVYGRPGCHFCQELDQKVLPVIRRQFRDVLDVEHRPAWERLPTPTIIVRGQRRTHFDGLPPVNKLREAIDFAQGKRARDPAS